MGTCKPMAVSFQCMTKSTTNKKKKKRERDQLISSRFREEACKGIKTKSG